MITHLQLHHYVIHFTSCPCTLSEWKAVNLPPDSCLALRSTSLAYHLANVKFWHGPLSPRSSLPSRLRVQLLRDRFDAAIRARRDRQRA